VALKQATSTIQSSLPGPSIQSRRGSVSASRVPVETITGFSHFDYGYGAKWVDTLEANGPEIDRLVVLERPADPSTAGYLKVIGPVAASLGLDTIMAEVIRPDDIEPALDAAVQESECGLLVLPDLIFRTTGIGSSRAAARHRLPAAYPNKIYVTPVVLMSYATHARPCIVSRASYVDRILREKTRRLPVQSPTTFNLVSPPDRDGSALPAATASHPCDEVDRMTAAVAYGGKAQRIPPFDRQRRAFSICESGGGRDRADNARRRIRFALLPYDLPLPVIPASRYPWAWIRLRRMTTEDRGREPRGDRTMLANFWTAASRAHAAETAAVRLGSARAHLPSPRFAAILYSPGGGAQGGPVAGVMADVERERWV